MNYYPPEKLCSNCNNHLSKNRKYYPVFRFKYINDITVYNYQCTICFIEEYMKTNNITDSIIFTNSEEQKKYELEVEHRFMLQCEYHQKYDKIVNTEMVDQERLAIIENLEEELVRIINTIKDVDTNIYNMINIVK